MGCLWCGSREVHRPGLPAAAASTLQKRALIYPRSIRKVATVTFQRGSRAAFAAVAALSCAAGAAIADPAEKSTSECLYVRNITNFNAADNQTLYVRVGVNQIFRFDLFKNCLGLTFRQSLTIKATGASPWICSPLTAQVSYVRGGIRQRCPVTAIHRLSDAEVAALPKGVRP